MLVSMMGKRKPSDEFSPLDISNCGLWLEAGSDVTLVDEKVSQWDDQSGNSRNYIQTNSSLRPSVDAAGINGLPAILFNSDSVVMRLYRESEGLLRNINGATIFAVFKSAGQNSSLTGQTLIWANTESTSSVQRFVSWQTANSTNGSVYGRRLDAESVDGSNTATGLFESGVAHIYTWIPDWANSALYIRRDGSQSLGDTEWTTDGYTSDTNSYRLSIGGNQIGNSYGSHGRLAEFIVYQRKLDSTELSQVEEYLGDKYGITVA